jgi:hypothetical protein
MPLADSDIRQSRIDKTIAFSTIFPTLHSIMIVFFIEDLVLEN